MMASQQSKVLDPMYNFDTHFPERLSRLHIHGDFNSSGSFRKKKSRAQRSGARYKTQPVTFDEIKEVDEEPNPAAGSSSGSAKVPDKRASSSEHLKGQLQAFSRSMDGLLPKSAVLPDHVPFHISHSRSGSRKFQRHPDCIPEKAESEAQQKQQQQQQNPEQRLSADEKSGAGSPTTASVASPQTATLTPPTDDTGKGGGGGGSPSPIPSPNIAPRRQKITAKAKKRQKAQGEGEGNLDT